MKIFTFLSISKSRSICLLVMIFTFSNSFAQNPYTIQFQDEIIEIQENIDSFQWNQMPDYSELNNGYVGWIQFFETPNQTIQDRFKNNNLQLLEYIPNRTYLFYFPNTTSINFLKDNGVRAIIPVEFRFKISSELNNPPYENWAMDGDNILVTLQFHKNVSSEFVINDLAKKQIAVKQVYKGSNNIDLSIPNNCLNELANLPYVKWVELIVAPSIPDDTRGRSLHRSNRLDTQTGAGRDYTGLGIGVMVRDDGIVGPHIDFQGRLDNSSASGTGSTHGDGVAGIMAGAGNLNPLMRGMAAGSDVYVVNYVSNFLDSATLNYINGGTVQITNSSYSNGCNAGYTSITQTVDTQANDILTLLHVFSAGNSNNNNCGYGAGNQWGNITGGHKQGKNVIATANVFFDGSLVNSSSRGPAHDGRIKPDITANGQNQNSTTENNGYQSFGGTSGAAPGIAGISAQLYQAYSEANGGNLPQSALIKATLLATANDAGNIGPDFKFGWGIVNAFRAGLLIEDGRHLMDNITQGNSNTHNINIPAGTIQVRFMLYWNDPAASIGSSPALVNDLDLLVTDPSSTVHEPWILDSTPDPILLNLPATQGPDHLNNMEEVLIDNPGSGNYEIEVTGFNVPMGPQEYFVVYEIISEEIIVTYPNAGESFVPGEQEAIHWDAINTTNDFLLEYSTNNGGSWNTITTVGPSTFLYSWTIPNSITGEALFRVTSGGFSDVSDDNFSIANLVTNVDVSQVCPAQATFTWNSVAGAESYDFYTLGSTYMDVTGNTPTTSITISIANPNDEIWFAVVAKNDTDGWKSRRTIAVLHPGGLVNCSLNNDLSIESINNTANDFNFVCDNTPVTISATIRNTGINPQSNFMVTYQLNNDPVVEETFTGTINSGQQVIFDFATLLDIATSGEYTLTVTVDLPGDENPSNDEATLDFYATIEATSLNFLEDFEINGMPPLGWTILNPDGSTTWVERSGITGSDGNPTVTAFIDNYTYNAQNQLDIIQTEIFDLTNAGVPSLKFDLAKAQYSTTFFDALRVEISIDCGISFTSIYEKTGLDLSTVPGYITFNWTPSSENDWRTEEIDLTPYEGENVLFRFVNINGYGNSTFIDNINVSAETLSVGENELGGISLYPNPASEIVFIDINTTVGNNYKIIVSNSLGQTIYSTNETLFNGRTNATLNVSGYASGLYFITIKVGLQSTIKKLIIK